MLPIVPGDSAGYKAIQSIGIVAPESKGMQDFLRGYPGFRIPILFPQLHGQKFHGPWLIKVESQRLKLSPAAKPRK